MMNFKIPELDNKKALLVIIISLLVLYLDFSFFIRRQQENISGISKKISQVQKDLALLSSDLAKAHEAKAKGETAPEQRKGRFIAEGEQSFLLQRISSLAINSEVKIMQMVPSRDTKPGSNNLFVALDLSCGYHQLGRFLSGLENDEIFMAVESLKISAQDTDYLKQKVDLTLRMYVKK